MHAQRQEAAVAIERQLSRQVSAAPVMIAGDRLGPRADPFHRAAAALRRQHEGEKLRVHLVAAAEAAADIDSPDAEALRREAGHVRQRRSQVAGPLAL